jgi:hypothetical protein
VGEAEIILEGLMRGGRDLMGRGRPVISVDVTDDERFEFDPALGAIHTLILVPCGTRDCPTGIVYLDRLRRDGNEEAHGPAASTRPTSTW